jgi:2'-5' RNA ligase
MPESIRSFIAIELNEATQGALAKIQNDLRSLDVNVKWVKSRNIHLTLRFLGHVRPKIMKKIIEGFSDFFKGQSSFDAELTHVGAFPRVEWPRIIWVGIEKNAQSIIDLAQQLENHLCKFGLKKESKVFAPHLTIGRVRSPKNITALSEALKNYSLSPIPQKISKITLFKSTLTSQGPIYEKLQTIDLKDN